MTIDGAAIHAGYTVMAQRERQGLGLTQAQGLGPTASNYSIAPGPGPSPCLPSHLARVLVLLGQERNYLNQVLQGVTVEQGQGRGEGLAATDENTKGTASDKSGPTLGLRGGAATGTRASLGPGPSPGSSTTFTRGERYSDFLYGELCGALLGMYLELKESLSRNAFPHGPGIGPGLGLGRGSGLGPAPSKTTRPSALIYPCTLVQVNNLT